jgi:polyhydroxyalkanoate synthesis regulator protein
MVLEGETFEVRDAKTGEDLTRSILLQIILEEESGGVPMFTTQMLAQIIRFYGHAMQGMMGVPARKEPAGLRRPARPAWPSRLRAWYDPEELHARDVEPVHDRARRRLMQGLMGNYLEQSKNLFVQMQEQMQEQMQAGALFPGIPGLMPKK